MICQVFCAALAPKLFQRLNYSANGFVSASLTSAEQRRTLMNKWNFQLPENYPDPWPYKEKGYSWYHALWERTKRRLHENSKLIVVEGNIGAGTSKFAEELADQLGFYHMPSFKMDDIFIDRYGNDLRNFYHLFPKRFRIPDANMFYQNPGDDNTAAMQDQIYACRWEQYLNALAHILNTGQGVVLDQSVYGDFVFVNAMRSKDWISPQFFKYYYFVRKITRKYLKFYPHVVVYLDCPTWKCLENIKERGNPHEIAAIDENYLKIIEESYKDLLKELKRYSYILTYDWTQPEFTDTVVEDIEQLNLDMHEWHGGEVMEDWFAIDSGYRWNVTRYQVTDKHQYRTLAFEGLQALQMEISELYVYPPDGAHWRNVMIHEVLKDTRSYGFTHKDPIQDLMHINTKNPMPEKWFEYFYKEAYYSGLNHIERNLDPTGKDYNREYLTAH